MNSIIKPVLGLALVATVAACGQPAGKNTAVTDPNARVAGEGAATPTAGVFDPGESQMGDQMKAAVGSDIGDNWVRKMIAHHQGAIDMSKVVLGHMPTVEAGKMAKMTIEKQGHEIDDLKKLIGNGKPDQKSAGLYEPAMMQMQQAMMSASGLTVSEAYLRKMLAHHEGAVAMSDIALKNGVTGAVKAQVEKTRADQQKEVEMVKAMLGNLAR